MNHFKSMILLKCLFLALASMSVAAWSPKTGRSRRVSSQRPPMTMYVPPNTPTSETASITAQKMLKTAGATRTMGEQRKTTVKLSQSVLASCDTLPSFRTAHGILSPETVKRMEEIVDEGDRSEALNMFLRQYRRNGPMSCLPMLSDPDVLPHLTNAMRNILE
jgi:hypothetical protein